MAILKAQDFFLEKVNLKWGQWFLECEWIIIMILNVNKNINKYSQFQLSLITFLSVLTPKNDSILPTSCFTYLFTLV